MTGTIKDIHMLKITLTRRCLAIFAVTGLSLFNVAVNASSISSDDHGYDHRSGFDYSGDHHDWFTASYRDHHDHQSYSRSHDRDDGHGSGKWRDNHDMNPWTDDLNWDDRRNEAWCDYIDVVDHGQVVPLPAAVWLLASGLVMMGIVGRRRQ